MPKKADGRTRGFAFVEYGSSEEAKHAFLDLQGVHLYGRRLVVLPAEAEQGLD